MAARVGSILAAAGLAMAAAGSVCAADPDRRLSDKVADQVSELEPMTVTPSVNPLDESLEHLRAMMENAPCLGCDDYVPQRDVYDAVREVIVGLTNFTAYPIAPPNPSLDERRDDRLANEWRVSDYGPEMQAFR